MQILQTCTAANLLDGAEVDNMLLCTCLAALTCLLLIEDTRARFYTDGGAAIVVAACRSAQRVCLESDALTALATTRTLPSQLVSSMNR